jgi:tRNA-splicing ligase RtcB
MFVFFDKSKQQKPIKIWLENIDQVDEGCLQQVINLSNLPFIHKWPALMPDCHQGYGMPIGGVLAADEAIIPNAVGVDIGCGVCFVQTDVSAEISHKDTAGQGKLIQAIIGQILRTVPTGFEHHKKKRQCTVLDWAADQFPKEHLVQQLVPELDSGYYQVGTLGGGNHFIEIQEDEDGLVGLMVHSGSRNFGYKVCNYFNKLAKGLNIKWKSPVPAAYDLAYFPVDSEEGQQYISWMQLAQDFARENRSQIMDQVQIIFSDYLNKHAGIQDVKFDKPINCHHNYASFEQHYAKDVWVHRKGAIRARKGEMGIIPGAMGNYSYIVEGLGNPESFHSCSHGAGRVYSRKKAKKTFPVQQVMDDLNRLGVTLGKRRKGDVAEECRMVYKDIDFVLSQQLDLVRPVKKLKTIGVVKG